MEKKIEFLQSRTAVQLSSVIDYLARDLDYIVNNLEPITPESEPLSITRHDVDCMHLIFLCDSLSCVIGEFKSRFV